MRQLRLLASIPLGYLIPLQTRVDAQLHLFKKETMLGI